MRPGFSSSLAALAHAAPSAGAEDAATGEQPDWPGKEWQQAAPEDVGVDPARLHEADAYLRDLPTQAFLVVRRGRIVHETYARGFGRDDLHNSYSIAKSVTAAAVGAAIHVGRIASVQSRLCDCIPADEVGTPDPERYGRITVEHLLTMTSGIDFSNREHYPEMTRSASWAGYVLRRPILHDPGTHWKYKADPTLLSAIVTRASGRSMFEFAQEHVFGKIGVTDARWDADPSGVTSGNGDFFATARDYARLGHLMLRDGVWDGTRLLPEGWVERGTAPCRSRRRAACDCWSETPVKIPDDAPPEYGYAWWCRRLPGVPDDAHYAFGGMGQFVLTIPSLDIVAVRLADDRVRSDQVVLPEMARLIARSVLSPAAARPMPATRVRLPLPHTGKPRPSEACASRHHNEGRLP